MGSKALPSLKSEAMKQACAKYRLPMHGVVYSKHWHTRLSDANPQVRKKVERVYSGHSWIACGRWNLRSFGTRQGNRRQRKPPACLGPFDRTDPPGRPARRELNTLIETDGNGFVTSEQFRDYIDACDSPAKAYYDIGNMQKFAPNFEWIRILGKRTVKLDVKDWDRRTTSARLVGEMSTGRKSATSRKDRVCRMGNREGNDGGIEKTAKLMNELLAL